MMTLTYGTFEYGGTEYEAIPARITRTALGPEDHGIFTVSLRCEWGGGSSQSMPGYAFGRGDEQDKAGAYIRRVLAVVGASRWEDVIGRAVYVLRSGGVIDGLLSLDERTVFLPAELFTEEREAARS